MEEREERRRKDAPLPNPPLRSFLAGEGRQMSRPLNNYELNEFLALSDGEVADEGSRRSITPANTRPT